MSQCSQEVFDVAWKLENTVPPVTVLSSTHRNFGSIVSPAFFVFQPLDPDTGAPLHEEREIAVRQELIVHFEFYL